MVKEAAFASVVSQQNNATFKSSFLAAAFGNGVEGVGRGDATARSLKS